MKFVYALFSFETFLHLLYYTTPYTRKKLNCCSFFAVLPLFIHTFN